MGWIRGIKPLTPADGSPAPSWYAKSDEAIGSAWNEPQSTDADVHLPESLFDESGELSVPLLPAIIQSPVLGADDGDEPATDEPSTNDSSGQGGVSAFARHGLQTPAFVDPIAEKHVRESVGAGIAEPSLSDLIDHPRPDPILDRRLKPRSDDHAASPELYALSVQTPTTQPIPNAHVVHKAKNYAPLSSKNGPALASLIIALSGLILGLMVPWWYAAAMASIGQILFVVTIVLLGIAVVLGAIGLVLAVRRPTTKVVPVAAVLLSPLFLIGAIVSYALAAAAPPPFDAADVESTIQAWYFSESGSVVTVVCPPEVPTTDGSVFICSAYLESGQMDAVQVRAQSGSFTWRTLTP
jgi:hypothetical protein